MSKQATSNLRPPRDPTIISGQLARVGDSPIARGAITDVWEGTYRNKKVSIRCLRTPLNEDQTLKKVRSRDGMP